MPAYPPHSDGQRKILPCTMNKRPLPNVLSYARHLRRVEPPVGPDAAGAPRGHGNWKVDGSTVASR